MLGQVLWQYPCLHRCCLSWNERISTDEEAVGVEEVGPAMIDEEEEKIDASNAVVAASEVVSDQVDVSASHAREGDVPGSKRAVIPSW